LLLLPFAYSLSSSLELDDDEDDDDEDELLLDFFFCSLSLLSHITNPSLSFNSNALSYINGSNFFSN
jgi:hypothetical protein